MRKILLMSLTVLVLTSCSKSKEDAPGQVAPGTRIKTRTTGSGITNYSYDAQGRIALITYANGDKHEYQYLPGKAITKEYDGNGLLERETIHELNADGYTTRATHSDLPGYEYLYFYNPDKTIAKQIAKNNSVTTMIFDYFWNNGNHDSTRYSNGNGVWNYTQVNTHYLDKSNSLADIFFGEELWGKDSKNLDKTTFNRNSDGSTSPVYTYTYEFDASGRVIKKTGSGNNNVSVTLFSY